MFLLLSLLFLGVLLPAKANPSAYPTFSDSLRWDHVLGSASRFTDLLSLFFSIVVDSAHDFVASCTLSRPSAAAVPQPYCLLLAAHPVVFPFQILNFAG